MKRPSLKIFIIVVIVLVIGAGIYIALTKDVATRFPYTEEGAFSNVKNFLNTIVGEKTLSFVLFGIPGEQYNGGRLTDSIIAIRISEEQKTIDMVSIPRDLWIWTGGEQFKLNESLVREKTNEAIKEIEKMVPFQIDGYVVLSLSFVSDVIDSLSGVSVTLDQPIIDGVSGFYLENGTHVLGGEDILWLVRNRFNSQGDFFREHNQHAVLEGLLERAKILSEEEKQSLIKKFIFSRNDIDLHIPLSSLLKFIGEDVADINSYTLRSVVIDLSTHLFEIITVPYDVREYETQNISAVAPKEGLGEYGDIREYIERELTE